MRKPAPRSRREPTIALINIVFLMLIFFMAAATIAPPIDGDLRLVRTEDLEGRAPPDALVVHADGRLVYRGAAVPDARAYMWAAYTNRGETVRDVRIVPDADLPAPDLIRLGEALRAAGAERVVMITERGLE
ncbi:ExbD/TolR family protein [Roseovarius sp. D22-M7]|uniref:ExbD/TolR family protein n=1 Tax=Roseovarius sp. D22-M7 TaxID=3127116 RepID=UPI00300FC305